MNPNNFCTNIKNYFTNTDNKFCEIVAFILFVSSIIFLSFFHEPWFDEFQAWGIAKDSIYNILFVIPHTEGHPPLWHLILKFFQQFTNNPELVLKIPNITVMIIAMWLCIFKSPFPKIIRITLPFTYFFFYQYSIVNRPYCLLVLAMFITAILYKTKDEHPFKFITALSFLSLTSAYGMLIATGICIAWVVEIWNKQNIASFLKKFFKDKRFYSMLILFFVCLFLALIIVPGKDVSYSVSFDSIPLWQKILYFYCGLPADATIFNILQYNTHGDLTIISFKNIVAILFGIYLNIVLLIVFKTYKQLSLLFCTYFAFITFGLFVYIWPHHIGILETILIFCFWVSSYNNERFHQHIARKQLNLIIALTIIVQVSWSIAAYYNEYKYNYAPSREITKFIRKYELYNYNIMSEWYEAELYKNEKGQRFIKEGRLAPFIYNDDNHQYKQIKVSNTSAQTIPILVNPYFNKNIFFNFNIDAPNKLYVLRTLTKYDNITKSKWAKHAKPDIIIGENVKIEQVWGKDFKLYGNYILLKNFPVSRVWKNHKTITETPLYVHKNLYDKMKDYK